ncbi:MAG: hypothetical protein RQ736_04935 [Thiogranum sp.]|nr:hypothetical protein [Thiogranum sp.]
MKVPLLLILLLTIPFSAVADPIEIIELRNRPAEELIPTLQPMLDNDASISGQGFTLIVRTSKENLEQIKSLVTRLDRAARQLLISVFHGSRQDLRALDLEGNLLHRDGRTSIHVRGLSTHTRLSDNPVHSLRVAEGTSGFIETGQSIPYLSGGTWVTPEGITQQSSVSFKDVVTGFNVFPRLHGDQVTLELSPFRNQVNEARADAVDTRRASTTITGPLGEWLQVGAVREQLDRSRSGPGTIASTRDRSAASIWIRADLIQ